MSDYNKPYTSAELDRFKWRDFEGWFDDAGERLSMRRIRATTRALEEACEEADEVRSDLKTAHEQWARQSEILLAERDEARAEVHRLQNLLRAEREQATKAQEAMGNGADDSRWRPGETAVEALIRERDAARTEAASLRFNGDSARRSLYDYMKMAEQLEAETKALREALVGLTVWHSTWRHAVRIHAIGGDRAWDDLELAHNNGCAALARKGE